MTEQQPRPSAVNAEPSRRKPRNRGLPWALLPVALLVAMAVGWAVMISIAVDDPGFAVERDYYKKAVAWDDEQAQQAHNERLGWRLEPKLIRRSSNGAEVTARVVDATGRPIENARVELQTFHNARAMSIIDAQLEPQGQGHYSKELPMDRPGLWELRFVVRRGGERFTAVVRRDLSTHAAGDPS